MNEVLIVDGYNIIGAWPELAAIKERSLEEARDRLIDILADYQGYTGMRVLLVFDAHQVPGLGGKYRQSGLDIVYSKEKETADEVIERLVGVFMENRRRRVQVATSDETEQHVIFGKGALRLSARELRIQVEQSRKDIQTHLREERVMERNTFDSKLSLELKIQLEKWRRGK